MIQPVHSIVKTNTKNQQQLKVITGNYSDEDKMGIVDVAISNNPEETLVTKEYHARLHGRVFISTKENVQSDLSHTLYGF